MKDISEIATELQAKYPSAAGYYSYSGIPAEHLSSEYLAAWIASGNGRYQDIPGEFRTEFLMRIAVNYDSLSLQYIDPVEVDDYQALVLDAIGSSISAAKMISPEYMTEDLVDEIAKRRSTILGYLGLDGQYSHLLTTRVVSSVVKQGLSEVHYLRYTVGHQVDNLIDDEDIKKAIKNNQGELNALDLFGKSYVFVDLLKAGYWPDKVCSGSKYQPLPSAAPLTPVEAMTRMKMADNKHVAYVYSQALKCFPIEKVISSTQSIPGVVDLLMKAYTEQELRPHLRLSKALRGRLLESALGL
jgi:hypothetical protein